VDSTKNIFITIGLLVLTNCPMVIIIENMDKKKLSTIQIAKRDRDKDIKYFYENLPYHLRSVRAVAKYFKVSRMTVWYAVNGRNKTE